MAAEFPPTSDDHLRPRKGHDRAWSCDKHDEPISFHCKEHNIPICQKCAIKDHVKGKCKLDDIEDVILKLGKELEATLLEVTETTKRLKRLNSEIQSCSAVVNNHLKTVGDEINLLYESKIKSINDKEQDDIDLIKKEADEEMRVIRAKMEKRIALRKSEVKKQQQIIEEARGKLLTDHKTIVKKVGQRIEDVGSKDQHKIDTMNVIESSLKRIKTDDKMLVNEAPPILASFKESEETKVYQYLLDTLDHLKREVQRLNLVEGNVGGEDTARIDGYIGKWELVKAINIPIPDIRYFSPFYVRGFISNDEICVSHVYGGLYVTNIANGQTHRVIKGNRNSFITSCARLDSNLIVCGKCRRDCQGNSFIGCITLYDRQWKVVRDITIPRDDTSSKVVFVDVDKDGMILATGGGQSNIYVINPADGKIVKTVFLKGIRRAAYGCPIAALPSGGFVLETLENNFSVITRSGEKRSITHYHDFDHLLATSICLVDKVMDNIFVSYRPIGSGICAVDQVSCAGNIQTKRIVEFEAEYHGRHLGCSVIVPSGELVSCTGKSLLIHKKIFDVKIVKFYHGLKTSRLLV